MLKTYKYRIFPTKKQITILNSNLNECRWLYNHFLEERKNIYEQERKSLNYYSQAVSIVKLKQDRPSLSKVYSQVLQNVAVRVDLAFQSFFRRVKAGEKPGYPRFKSFDRYDSFTFPQTGFEIIDNRVKLSKIGSIKVKLHRPVVGIIKTCSIRRKTGKWYICFSAKYEPKPLRKNNKAIGIDVGLKTLLLFLIKIKLPILAFLRQTKKHLRRLKKNYLNLKEKLLKERKLKKLLFASTKGLLIEGIILFIRKQEGLLIALVLFV